MRLSRKETRAQTTACVGHNLEIRCFPDRTYIYLPVIRTREMGRRKLCCSTPRLRRPRPACPRPTRPTHPPLRRRLTSIQTGTAMQSLTRSFLQHEAKPLLPLPSLHSTRLAVSLLVKHSSPSNARVDSPHLHLPHIEHVEPMQKYPSVHLSASAETGSGSGSGTSASVDPDRSLKFMGSQQEPHPKDTVSSAYSLAKILSDSRSPSPTGGAPEFVHESKPTDNYDNPVTAGIVPEDAIQGLFFL